MDFDLISKTALFHGCSPSETEQMLECLEYTIRAYQKDEVICSRGKVIPEIGIVLSGSAQIESDDIWGNRSVLSVVGQGGIFAEAYACVPDEPLMVNVVANGSCEILFLNVSKIFAAEGNTGPVHGKFIQNLVVVCAKKNLELSHRIFHTSSKTIRGRLMSYFSQQVSLQKSGRISIPFDRQQLADYLGVDRSALSKELGKMKKDGLLNYHKNQFELKASCYDLRAYQSGMDSSQTS